MTTQNLGDGPVPARGDDASARRTPSRRPAARTAARRATTTVAAGTAATLLAASLVAATPATAAPLAAAPLATAPAADCAAPFPVGEVTSGAPVTGLTVSKGTTPQEFTGEVLGVVADGIAPGLDLIVAELDSPAIEKAGGIWQGMSGSPVYAQDGRLIGAVAYGLAAGSSPVAGITPFGDMARYLGGAGGGSAPTTVKVGSTMANRIAAQTDATRAEAGQGLRQLPMPVGVGGISLARAQKSAKERGTSMIDADSYRIGRSSSAAAASVDSVVAGGNVAAVLSHGDITMAGVGTVTSVCGSRMVAFGHPMNWSGPARMGLAAADAVYVQEDPLGVPFKVANVGALGGTITDDRLAGIAGTFGAAPAAATVTSKVSYHGTSRTGTTKVLNKGVLGDVAFFATNSNHDRVADGWIRGSQRQSWTIRATHAGKPYTLRYADRYRSTYDIGWEGVFDVSAVVQALSAAPGTTVTSVVHDVRTSDDMRTYRVAKIEQRVQGRWVDVTGKRAKVKGGKELKLRVTLAGSDGVTRTFRHTTKVPKRYRGDTGFVEVVGGNLFQGEFFEVRPSFEAVRTALRTNQGNDEVRLALQVGTGRTALQRTTTTDPLPRVVGGYKSVRVKVTR
jgi:hypothetical protein